MQLFPNSTYVHKLRPLLPAKTFAPALSRVLWLPTHLAVIGAITYALASGQVPALLWPVAALLIGISFSGITFLAHETLHGGVVRNRTMRWLVGWIGLMPFVLSPRLWKIWHNREHHAHTNHATLDPDKYPILQVYQNSRAVRVITDSFSLGGDVGQTTEFAGLSKLDEILWDHRTSDHSPRGHPLGPLRAELRARRMPDAQTISRARHGQRVEYVGIVICRQRPSTASGVTFMTLEDETGFVNLVVWAAVFEKYSIIARSQSLLGVSGTLQVQEGIVHLIASALWVPELSRPVDAIGSRDFH